VTSPHPTFTALEISESVNGSLEGDPSRRVSGVGPVDEATPDMLTWIGAPRFAPRLSGSKAGVVLMPLEGEAPPTMTAIRVEDPDLALNTVLARFARPKDVVEPGVHPSAVIGEGAVVDGASIGPNVFVGADAVVGPRTTLYPGVFVGRGAVVGSDCVLWPNVVLREDVRIGDRVIIHANTTIGADGFSYLQRGGRHVRVPQIGTVLVEDDVEIGANTTIDRARSGATTIGRGTKIDNLVMVAHNCEIGEGCLLAATTGIAGSTTLGRYVVCGGRASIIDHLSLGDGTQVGAGTLVLTDLDAGSLVRGNPARPLMAFAREQVALKKLPELLKKVRDLEETVKRLRAAVGDG